jgi:putative transposase
MLDLRHELAILRRQAAPAKLTQADRALLAALSRSLPRPTWASFPVNPATLLRWHRQLVARRWTYPQRKPGRPPLESSLRMLILRLAGENPHWGYQRIAGELKGVGVTVSATLVRKVLLEAGLPPAPERTRSSPVQAPNANAHAERWVRTLRADCLDRILILGRRHLEHVLRVYRRHYNSTGRTARSASSRRTAATQRR